MQPRADPHPEHISRPGTREKADRAIAAQAARLRKSATPPTASARDWMRSSRRRSSAPAIMLVVMLMAVPSAAVSIRGGELVPILGRQAGSVRVLAQLKYPDVGRDGPAVARRESGRHRNTWSRTRASSRRSSGRPAASAALRCEYGGGGLKPRRTIMPRPSPSSPWHGVQ